MLPSSVQVGSPTSVAAELRLALLSLNVPPKKFRTQKISGLKKFPEPFFFFFDTKSFYTQILNDRKFVLTKKNCFDEEKFVLTKKKKLDEKNFRNPNFFLTHNFHCRQKKIGFKLFFLNKSELHYRSEIIHFFASNI